MSEAKAGNANAAKTTEPQIVAHLNYEQPRSDSGKMASRVEPQIDIQPKHDAAKKNERKASTALAQQIGTNRGAVERQHEVSNPRAGEKVLVPPQIVATPEAPQG